MLAPAGRTTFLPAATPLLSRLLYLQALLSASEKILSSLGFCAAQLWPLYLLPSVGGSCLLPPCVWLLPHGPSLCPNCWLVLHCLLARSATPIFFLGFRTGPLVINYTRKKSTKASVQPLYLICGKYRRD